MKLWILSDLHLRLRDARVHRQMFDQIPAADVCVLAGDVTDSMTAAIDWVGSVIAPRMPVVMVLGNHDFYGEIMEDVGRRVRRAAAHFPGLHLLADNAVLIKGVRFVGGTLWTDFKLFESGAHPVSEAECRAIARRELPDYSEIYATGGDGVNMGRMMTPRDTVAYHQATRAFLEEELRTPFCGPTVVVTHHAPARASLSSKYADKASSAAFASDLTGLMLESRPELWVHGHVHHSVDAVFGGTRVVCNPRGYESGKNADFDPTLVIEL